MTVEAFDSLWILLFVLPRAPCVKHGQADFPRSAAAATCTPQRSPAETTSNRTGRCGPPAARGAIVTVPAPEVKGIDESVGSGSRIAPKSTLVVNVSPAAGGVAVADGYRPDRVSELDELLDSGLDLDLADAFPLEEHACAIAGVLVARRIA